MCDDGKDVVMAESQPHKPTIPPPSSPLSSPPESISTVDYGGADDLATTVKPSDEDNDAPSVVDRMKEMEIDSITVDPSNEAGAVSSSTRTVSVANGKKRKTPLDFVKRTINNKRAKNEAKKWEAPEVYTDAKSPLANADIRAMLLNPKAWDWLKDDEQDEILGLLPDKTHVISSSTGRACPDVHSLRNDDTFRYDSARYLDAISDGKHDRQWLAEAYAAHEERKLGHFDQHLMSKLESNWAADVGAQHYDASLRRKMEEAGVEGPIIGHVEQRPLVMAPSTSIPAYDQSVASEETTAVPAALDALQRGEDEGVESGKQGEAQAISVKPTNGQPGSNPEASFVYKKWFRGVKNVVPMEPGDYPVPSSRSGSQLRPVDHELFKAIEDSRAARTAAHAATLNQNSMSNGPVLLPQPLKVFEAQVAGRDGPGVDSDIAEGDPAPETKPES